MILTTKRLMILASVILYFCFYQMGNHEVRVSLSIIVCIVTVLTHIYFFHILYKHMQIKKYFWNNLDTKDKGVVNYFFHRCAFAESVSKYHPFFCYWKKEVKFQEKRNTIIIKSNQEKGELLISLERLLCYIEILLVFLFTITDISLGYA